MKRSYTFFLALLIITAPACNKYGNEPDVLMEVKKEVKKLPSLPFLTMSHDSLYNKVLGSLVGSAIGDAMGAPTEMWPRPDIKLEFGFVDSLDNMVREPSPEGIWDYNLPAGGTTDDTRWKVFLGHYIIDNAGDFYTMEGPDPYDFARTIVDQYKKELEAMKKTESFDPAPLEEQMWRIAWLQEFALVAKPFAEKDMEEYHKKVNKFYGGDMACPGLLYSPAIGLPFPGAPGRAYEAAYRLSIFDIGYAMDIMALSAGMVAAAMPYDSSPEKILAVNREVDPEEYFRSRLLGRITYRIFRDALHIVNEANKVQSADEVELTKTPDMTDILYQARMQKAFDLLDDRNQDVPFHSGEIHLINLTALMFSDFDFRKAMEFVINYGRDNDTVAAVTGAILGAYYGFDKLPDDLKNPVLETNKKRLGIDLETLARQFTDRIIENNGVSPGR